MPWNKVVEIDVVSNCTLSCSTTCCGYSSSLSHAASLTKQCWKTALGKIRTLTGRALLTGCLLGASTSGYGFESHEHKLFGDAALAAALDYLEDLPLGRHDPAAIQAGNKMKGAYGTLVKCVDQYLIPEKMLARAWKENDVVAAVEGEAAGSTPTTASSVRVDPPVVPVGESNKGTMALLKSCENEEWFASIQASHNNHAHFQRDLLISLRLFHAAAVGVAVNEGNVYGALLLNAISDHYLQDFFAPGHIVTPRDRLTDLPATATHDLANQMGAIFYPQAAGLADLLAYLCGVAPQEFDPRNGPQTCRPGAKASAILATLNISDVQASMRDILQSNAVLFRGDGQLMNKELATQRLLLLAVQMRSVLDVLTGTNSFKSVNFAYDLKHGLPSASIDFGAYSFQEHGKKFASLLHKPATTDASDVSDASDASDPKVPTQVSQFSVCSWGQCENRLYKLRTRSPVIGVSFQRESQSSGEHSARNLFMLEFSTVGVDVGMSWLTGRLLSSVEAVPVFGYAFFQESGRHGSGPTFRLPFFIPETEFALGPYARVLDYGNGKEQARRLSYGLRMDAGFSTYATFFIGFGLDHDRNASGQLGRTRLWSAGFRFGFPLSRLPLGKSVDMPPQSIPAP